MTGRHGDLPWRDWKNRQDCFTTAFTEDTEQRAEARSGAVTRLREGELIVHRWSICMCVTRVEFPRDCAIERQNGKRAKTIYGAGRGRVQVGRS